MSRATPKVKVNASTEYLEPAAEVLILRERLADALAREHRLREAAQGVVAGIESWERAVESIIGREPHVNWGSLDELRAALAEDKQDRPL